MPHERLEYNPTEAMRNPYQSANIEDSLLPGNLAGNEQTLDVLRRTRPWILTVGITCIIFGVLAIFFAGAILVMGPLVVQPSGPNLQC